MMQTVLIVDDELMIREAVSSYLKKQGCRALCAETGTQALAILGREPVTFVILDLMLPDMAGEAVCAEIRKRSTVPIIMLTAKAQEGDILTGLDLGADDYVTKPFSLRQLYARMNAVLRRVSDAERPERRAWNGGDLTIDFGRGAVYKKGRQLALTPIEQKILEALARRPGKTYTREELIALAFDPDFDGYDRVIDTHIKNLRKKVEDDPKKPVYVRTVHGLGYRFGGDGA
ncbi:MAG: response regulator transcription factor [Eubacteriales bacterium]|nr:response regulator transcription factor [Eubacteriales bacterium]